MHIKNNGLELCFYFAFGLSEHLKLSRTYGCRAKRGDDFQVFEEQGACYERYIAVIERHFGLSSADEFRRRAFGNVQKGIDFSLLNGAPCFVHIRVMCHHLCVLKGI